VKLTAVQLDEYISKLTPEHLAAIRAAGPVALHDQIDAAAAESTATAEKVADGTGQTMGYVPRGEVDEWLRLGLLDAFAAWMQGEATTCRHAPTLASPKPVWTCAWRPRLIVCTRCIHLLPPADPITDATCDRCGHVCAGVDADDPIYCLTVVGGLVTFQAGVCTDCLPAWHEHARTYLRPKVNRRARRSRRR